MPAQRVGPESYTEDYFLSECHGWGEYLASGGMELPARLQAAFDLGAISPGMRVLDIGSGRGEIALHCALSGANVYALDYSIQALQLAGRIFSGQPAEIRDRVHLQRADAQHLPFARERFDRVFMLDIVEHLYHTELTAVLGEIHRVMTHEACLVVHTMPNLWYLRYGYPIYRLVQRLRGQHLPSDPRHRWSHGDVHVNEQSIRRLKRSLSDVGFRSKVWLRTTEDFEREENGVVRAIMRLLASVYPFRWVFCNDIFSTAAKI